MEHRQPTDPEERISLLEKQLSALKEKNWQAKIENG